MSKINNGGLDQYETGPFEQQQCGAAGTEWVNYSVIFVNENENGEKRENNAFVNEN